MIEANPFGPLITPENVIFRLWAPGAQRVELLHHQSHEMRRTDDGWFKLTIPGAHPGDRYKFRIDGETEVPDPASCFQPDDVHGPSEVIDHNAFDWQTRAWPGRPWHECVFLELHVGTFTKDGTFRGVIDKLDDIAAAGITAIELMPVADFFGRWNWGYDGVLLYAPDSAYGRPDDLKALVDAAHARGLMVFLDVVYNHFGPEGNYLSAYAPQFFTPAQTPWGDAIDYERPEVRRFAVENALHWLSEYRFDGLRLDAVHAVAETGRSTLLREMSESVGTLASQTARHIHLVLENDANQASLLDPVADPPHGRYRAQWNDDYHHAFHVLLTGETQGYYGDYRDAQRHVVRVLAEGFAYQGESSPHRGNEKRGDSTANLPATAFVNFLQNHDQIGNRALGERLDALAKPEALEAALAITLLAPGPPLLFMGEQWGAREPFPFFCDFKGDLAEAVRKGRRKEFREAYVQHGDDVPDPLSEQTVRSATLDWSAVEQPAHRARLELVTRMLAARREFVMPRLLQLRPGHGRVELVDGVLTAAWFLRSGETLSIVANLTGRPLPRPRPFSQGEAVWGDITTTELPPWSVQAANGA
jgi:maltooligosyltrehalose trehalohydrolase